MQIRQIDIRHFRGFHSLSLKPRGHVLLVGEPRAGRSDLIEALTRVLDPQTTRSIPIDDLDFFNRDTSTRAEVEVVLGDLGEQLKQIFFNQIEFWDADKQELLTQVAPGEEVPTNFEPVVRLCYRAEWCDDELTAEHWVDFPKFSNPDTGEIHRVRRVDREALPFQRMDVSGAPLKLSPRSPFRRVVSLSEGEDFPNSLGRIIDILRESSGEFTESEQVKTALQAVLRDVALPLGLEDMVLDNLVKFVPDGGSLPALLRSINASVDLGDQAGQLPLQRHGSTTRALIATGEALATINNSATIVVVDDFGEGMDVASGKFMAQSLRSQAKQAWISTRRSSIAEAFQISEIVRLARNSQAIRCVFQGTEPTTRPERIAARHLQLQLLPAVAARAVVIVEGAHDHAAYQALATRLFNEHGIPPLGAYGIHLIHSGAADSSGGSSAIPKLATAARALGWRVVVIIDHDGNSHQESIELKNCIDSADAVVRLPYGFAIEKSLVRNVDITILKETLDDLIEAFDLKRYRINTDGTNLDKQAEHLLKKAGGLHAQFVSALPANCLPPIARCVLQVSLDCALGATDGLVEL